MTKLLHRFRLSRLQRWHGGVAPVLLLLVPTSVLIAVGVALLPALVVRGTLPHQTPPMDGAEAPDALAQPTGGGRVSGDLKQWQTVTVDFDGQVAGETDNTPNPFLDFRLQVTFDGPSGQTLVVPGFFDGDGRGGDSGSVWRVRFTPAAAGRWTYRASFRTGPQIAVDLDPHAGEPAAFDGASGAFDVGPAAPDAPGFLKWGRLEYVGGHYLKFRDGPYWLKGGADSPENLLGYVGFDDTPAARHTFAPHARDWRPGDPRFNAAGPDGGRGLIGALNYLAARRVNSVYFLPMNIGGDGRDTWPFAGQVDPHGSPANDHLHYDVSKLAQWEQAFAHAQRLGILLHFVLGESEPANRTALDGGALGVERKLFYRELVARFAHHNALQWNLAEEYDGVVAPEYGLEYPGIPVEEVKASAAYLQALDPYRHPITVHQWRDPAEAWAPFAGDSRFSVTSFQYGGPSVAGYGTEVEAWRRTTAAAGRPLPISLDEPRSSTPSNADAQRKELLWPTYLSGGQVEWFIGAEDQSLEDFRPYEALWTYTWYARKFMEEQLPFWEMEPADDLLAGESEALGGGQVFAKTGQVYAVYLPEASATGALDLSGAAGTFVQRWYSPRSGQFEGAAQTIAGGDLLPLGVPPAAPAEDWVVLLERQDHRPGAQG